MCPVTHRDSRWAGIPIASLPVLHHAKVNRTWCVNSSFQMQLRDYPQPLLAMTEVTISGRMLFAEQEAQERGSWDHQPHIEFTQLSYQQRGFLSCSVVLHHGSHLIWWRPRVVLFELWLCNKLMPSWWPISLVNNYGILGLVWLWKFIIVNCNFVCVHRFTLRCLQAMSLLSTQFAFQSPEMQYINYTQPKPGLRLMILTVEPF